METREINPGQIHSTEAETPAGSYAFPLTFGQVGMWFLEELEPEQSSYLIPWALRIRGDVDEHALATSLNQLVARHEIFRTTFKVSGDEPQQWVLSTMHVPLPIIDLTRLDVELRDAEARRLVAIEAATPINLQTGPIVRVKLLRLAGDDRILLLTTHHIVFDGWSRGILLRELGALYESAAAGKEPALPELPIQYGDFAVWQREFFSGENLDRQVSYWKKQLEGSPESLELPTDRPRPAIQTVNGAVLPVNLPVALCERLKAASRQHGVTLYMTMLAAFQVLLSRYSGKEDILIGTPIANRNRVEVQGLIGLFANTLVMRTRLDGDPTFAALLGRVKETALSAYAHQDMPFERLVQEVSPERSLSQSPLFQVLFSLRNVPPAELAWTDLKLEFFGSAGETSKYDLSLYLEEYPGGIRGKVEYNTDLFDAATVERMSGHYRVLLESILAGPEKRISQLEILDAVERHKIVVEWNRTEQEYDRTLCLHELFERQVKLRADSPAVAFLDQRLSYRQLNERANQLAHLLRKHGSAPGQRVGICLGRSLNMMVALLGALKSGAAYVPLDPSYPRERLMATLESADVALLITEEGSLPLFPEYAGPAIFIDRDHLELEQQSVSNPERAARPEDSAYIIFTSGSTGRPKGVEIRHSGLVNLLCWMQQELQMGPEDVFAAVASFGFDMSVPELYLALISGGMVALGERHLAADGEEFASFLRAHRASVVHATPTTWGLLLDAGFTGAGLKRCIGAEPLPAELFQRLMDAAPGTPLYNFYGPTETTVWSTVQRFEAAGERLTVGRPIANTQIYILDRACNPVPIGVRGELHIGGDGVAVGYLNQPGLTAEKFVANPFVPFPAGRMYKTGDLARYLPDGRIEFSGRIDHQVKIRGYRIELGEIETVLARHSSVRECVAWVREDVPGDKRLVAYVVAQPGMSTESAALREWVKERLPEYMVPTAFVGMEKLPLSPNGKVDRKALPAPEYLSIAAATAEMEGPVEESIAAIWAEVLGSGELTRTANFFEHGGHSLLATKVVAKIRQQFEIHLPLIAMFEEPTIAGLAVRVKTLAADKAKEAAPATTEVLGEQVLPLSFAQQRLWFLDQLEPGSAFNNVPWTMRFTGALDIDALKAALDEIAMRHEPLRARFQNQGGIPVQVIAADASAPMEVVDISGMPKPEREREASRLVEQNEGKPFSLSTGPLFRARAIKLADDNLLLSVAFHHAICDSWSLGLFSGELAALYEAFHAGTGSPLRGLPLTYGGYAAWQRAFLDEGALEQQLAYWREQMQGAPAEIELPTDRPRPRARTSRVAEQTLLLPKDLLFALKRLSRAEGVSLFITLLAGFNVLLSRYSGQRDIVVGTETSGRHHPDTEKLIGAFANTLVLRTSLVGDPTFREVVARVRETTLNAYAHQDVPFEKLVEELNPARHLNRTPLFQVMMVQQNAARSSHAFQTVQASPIEPAATAARVDLLLNVAERDGGHICTMEYDPDLYEASTIVRMLEDYRAVLDLVVKDPAQRVSDFPLPGAGEGALLLSEVHAVAANGDRNGHLSNRPKSSRADGLTGTPASPYEVGLVAIWKELLKLQEVKLDDDFFNLGGHSLLAVQMMFRAGETFRLPLPLTLLFAYPRLGELAHAISEFEKPPSRVSEPAAANGRPVPPKI